MRCDYTLVDFLQAFNNDRYRTKCCNKVVDIHNCLNKDSRWKYCPFCGNEIRYLRFIQGKHEYMELFTECDGCIHNGQYENEIENGYDSPCTRCRRRCLDNYDSGGEDLIKDKL